MSFTVLQNSTTADADTLMDNLYYIAQGSRMPMGGDTLEATGDAYDLGSTSARWNNVYCQNLNITGSITSDGKFWSLEAEIETTGQAGDIEFTGLNGDATNVYKIIANYKLLGSSIATIRLWINSDTATNYGYQKLDITGSTVTAGRTATTHMLFGYTAWSTTPAQCFGKAILSTKAGKERMMLNEHMQYGGGTYVEKRQDYAQIWDNTTDTITSLKLDISVSGQYFITGCVFQLWSTK